jgi:hypothetical protein
VQSLVGTVILLSHCLIKLSDQKCASGAQKNHLLCNFSRQAFNKAQQIWLVHAPDALLLNNVSRSLMLDYGSCRNLQVINHSREYHQFRPHVCLWELQKPAGHQSFT